MSDALVVVTFLAVIAVVAVAAPRFTRLVERQSPVVAYTAGGLIGYSVAPGGWTLGRALVAAGIAIMLAFAWVVDRRDARRPR